jgi:hypothetical protein
MMRAATIVAAVLALAGAAGAATTGRVIARGEKLKGGGTKIELIEAIAVRPNALVTRVIAAPKQSVKLQYSVVCVTGSKVDQQGYNASATPKTGQTTITAPGSFTLPMAFKHPSSCEVAVYSTLSKGGKQTVALVQT